MLLLGDDRELDFTHSWFTRSIILGYIASQPGGKMNRAKSHWLIDRSLLDHNPWNSAPDQTINPDVVTRPHVLLPKLKHPSFWKPTLVFELKTNQETCMCYGIHLFQPTLTLYDVQIKPEMGTSEVGKTLMITPQAMEGTVLSSFKIAERQQMLF